MAYSTITLEGVAVNNGYMYKLPNNLGMKIPYSVTINSTEYVLSEVYKYKNGTGTITVDGVAYWDNYVYTNAPAIGGTPTFYYCCMFSDIEGDSSDYISIADINSVFSSVPTVQVKYDDAIPIAPIFCTDNNYQYIDRRVFFDDIKNSEKATLTSYQNAIANNNYDTAYSIVENSDLFYSANIINILEARVHFIGKYLTNEEFEPLVIYNTTPTTFENNDNYISSGSV